MNPADTQAQRDDPQSFDHVKIEVCIASVADAVAAEKAGADRLELNQAIELGGLTPPVALLQQVKSAVSLPVVCMVRPRGGGFHYRADELMVMHACAKRLLEAGADGIVCGALNANDGLHSTFWRDLQAMVRYRELIFHRAIDTIESPEKVLEELIALNTTRVLTSGGQPTVMEGIDQIHRWQRDYGSKIEILPGAGVRPDNAVKLLRQTGCQQLHGTFSAPTTDAASPVAADEYPAASLEVIAALRTALAVE